MKQQELLHTLSKLTDNQRMRLELWLKDQMKLKDELSNTKPEICPYCHKASDMIRKGIYHKKQRYMCKKCGKHFIYDSHTITSYMKIDKDVFYEIILDTIKGNSIKYTAARLDLPVKTVFYNRHKFLYFLEEYLNKEEVKLSGTVEIDETYELLCQKGKRDLKRKARKRGGHSKLRGLSHEQICIITTTDRNTHEIFKAIGLAKPTTEAILHHFESRIINDSIIYTDGAFCYDRLAANAKSKLVNLETYYSYNNVEHLNTVNNIHSLIQQRLSKYRGVSSKYINRYLSLFVILRRFLDTDDNEIMSSIIAMNKRFECKITYNHIRNNSLFMPLQICQG